MSFTTLAFFTGLFGSLHCVAMCGPLVTALPFSNTSYIALLLQRLLYQVGRISMYSILGLITGAIGSGFTLLGLQQALSLTTGLLLVIFGGFHFFGRNSTKFSQMQSRLVAPLMNIMGRHLSKPYGGLFAGALNGLLPCGMVYVALATSVNAESIFAGSEFMLFFGLGTTPLMLLVSFAPIFFKKRLRLPLITPYLFVLAGVWLIYRGTNFHPSYASSHIPAAVSQCK
mgnify:CR=1 FL=1